MRVGFSVFSPFRRNAPRFSLEVDFVPPRCAKFLDAGRREDSEENSPAAEAFHHSRDKRLDFGNGNSRVMFDCLYFALRREIELKTTAPTSGVLFLAVPVTDAVVDDDL